MSEFWRAIIYVLGKVGLWKPYLKLVDFVLDKYCNEAFGTWMSVEK